MTPSPAEPLGHDIDPSVSSEVEAFVSLTTSQPRLNHLFLKVVRPSNPTQAAEGYTRLASAVASLRHLHTLTLEAPPDPFSLLRLESPLSHIELSCPYPFTSFTPFEPLLLSVAGTLQSLKGAIGGRSSRVTPDRPISLPTLTRLHVYEPSGSALLTPGFLSFPALHTLSFDWFSAATASFLLPFIQSDLSLSSLHFPPTTLSVHSDAYDELWHEVEMLGTLCNECGIEVDELPTVEEEVEHALPAPPSSSSPYASLSILPPELKLKIVEEVVGGFEEEQENFYRDAPICFLQSRFNKYKQPTSLVNLSAVDKEFRMICEPYLWCVVHARSDTVRLSSTYFSQEVNLVDLPVETLFVFFREILSKHALSIRKLAVGQDLELQHMKMPSTEPDKQVDRVVRAVQELARRVERGARSVRSARHHRARVVRPCISVEDLHLVSAAYQADEHPLRTALSTLHMAASWSLKVLRVDVGLSSFPFKHLIDLLHLCSATLVDLTLAEEDHAFSRSPRARELAQGVSDLPHLHYLALIGFDSRLLPMLSLSSPISLFKLVSYNEDYMCDLAPLLVTLSTSLQPLEFVDSLALIRHEESEAYSSSSRLALPFLSRLSLYDADSHLLDLRDFDLSTIEHLFLESWSGSVNNLREFVESSSTLAVILAMNHTPHLPRG
ncbi:hypothetical protein JCM8547_001204 [Rhodosporidiobolus lusitaniae]